MMNWIFAMSEAASVAVDTIVPEASANSALVGLPLISKGLLTTAVGLMGVFLVLALFFVTIRLMQLIKVKSEEN